MWTILTVVSVVAVLVVLAMRTVAKQPTSDPHEQETTIDPHSTVFPDLGDDAPRRSDGSPIPGSEEDRHRHGKK